MTRLEHRLNALATMSPAQLRDEWQDAFREPAPSLSNALLRYALAYRLQERDHGGLSATAQRVVSAMRTGTSTAPTSSVIRLKPGTRLLREWKGVIHAVLVTDEGLMFQNRGYSSLSQIAKEITGAHWSGPRFFGLRAPPNPPCRGATIDG